MKILCIIEALGSGGAERQLVGLASLLKKDGHDVAVMTYYPKDFYKYILVEAGVEHIYLPEAQSKSKRLPELRKNIKKYDPDVVVCYSPSAAEVACMLKMLGMKFKLIVSERNSIRNNSWREKIKFFLYRRADFVVPNSHEQESFIVTHYPRLKSKTKVITNFVDTDFFFPVEKQDSHHICHIVCVGRDNPQKNQLRFIDALKILADKNIPFKVDWYGSFESEYGRQCVKKIHELHLEKWIELKGETKNVRDAYQTHDVFCLPSIYEGFPNVLCEAMSCGLPVVCSDVCDNPLIVEDGVNGYLFNPKDPKDMAKKLEKMILLNEPEKKRISEQNREKSLLLFSKDTFLAKYEKLF